MDKTFDADMNCILTLWTQDPAPYVNFSVNDSHIFANTTVKIQCQKTPDDPVYYQVTDLILGIDIKFVLNITNDMTLYVHIDKLSISVVGYTDNTVKVSLIKTKAALSAATIIITGLVNSWFDTPISIANFLILHHLSFLDLTEITVLDGDGYLYIGVTPEYRRNQSN